MKRIVILALCLLALGSSAFALDKAAGGGLLFGYTFQGGEEDVSGFSNYSGNAEWTFNRSSIGGFAFFGLGQYVELNLAFMYKNGEVEAEFMGRKLTGSDVGIKIDPTAAVGFGAYYKYPIPVSDKVVVFPTGGFDFEINLNSDWMDEFWNDLWIRAGAGVDYFFSDVLFLRGHFIYGVVLPLGAELYEPDMGHGLLVKVGLGYMF
jgi:hypothetical protein